jgi:hypothetical protein
MAKPAWFVIMAKEVVKWYSRRRTGRRDTWGLEVEHDKHGETYHERTRNRTEGRKWRGRKDR